MWDVRYNMIRRLLLVVGIIVSLSSCGGDIAYRIEGKLTNLEDQTLYAVFENEDIKVVDTVTCGKPGEFLIEKKQGDFREVTIFFADKMHWVTAYLEKGEKVTITGDVDYPAMLRVKGGRINDRLSTIRKEMAPLLKEQADLIRQLNKKNRENLNSSIEEADMASRLANVNHLLSEEAAAAIKKYPDEEASVVLIQHYFNHPDDTRQMDELLAVLNPKLNDFYLVRKLQEYSTRAKRTALGAEAPGCDMCQTEDLYLDEVAMKYPKEKVDMLLVSLDDDQAEVRKVLAKDSIGWNLVTDSAGQAAMLVDLYNVSALPRCFLIDEEGKIILKTDNGVEIKQTLEKLME